MLRFTAIVLILITYALPITANCDNSTVVKVNGDEPEVKDAIVYAFGKDGIDRDVIFREGTKSSGPDVVYRLRVEVKHYSPCSDKKPMNWNDGATERGNICTRTQWCDAEVIKRNNSTRPQLATIRCDGAEVNTTVVNVDGDDPEVKAAVVYVWGRNSTNQVVIREVILENGTKSLGPDVVYKLEVRIDSYAKFNCTDSLIATNNFARTERGCRMTTKCRGEVTKQNNSSEPFHKERKTCGGKSID